MRSKDNTMADDMNDDNAPMGDGEDTEKKPEGEEGASEDEGM